MKKVIFLMLLVFASVGNLTANDYNSAINTGLTKDVENLTLKLNTLQHDYDYLYCNYMLSDIQLNLKDFMNDLSTKSNAILINCYHSRFNIDLYKVYSADYDASIYLYDSMKEKAEAITSVVILKMYTSNFSDDEIKLLDQGCKYIDVCLNTAQKSLNYYKVVLDMCEKLR